MTTRRPPRQLTGTALKARCRSLRAQLLGQQVATAEELADVWPGGASNRGVGMDGWIECYAQLTRFAGRLEAASRGTAGTDPALLEQTVRAAASRQPVPVVLSIGERSVYPKSAWALAWLDALDAIVQPAARLVTALAERDVASDEVRGFGPLTAALAFRTWAWILLSEGVGLPFPAEGVISPPEYTEQLLPEDYLAIYVAHQRLHFEAIALMSAAMPAEDHGPERSRLSLSGFLSGYASEHGVPPSHIVRRWSFPEAVAAALASAEAHRVAQANAKAKRKDGAS